MFGWLLMKSWFMNASVPFLTQAMLILQMSSPVIFSWKEDLISPDCLWILAAFDGAVVGFGARVSRVDMTLKMGAGAEIFAACRTLLGFLVVAHVVTRWISLVEKVWEKERDDLSLYCLEKDRLQLDSGHCRRWFGACVTVSGFGGSITLERVVSGRAGSWVLSISSPWLDVAEFPIGADDSALPVESLMSSEVVATKLLVSRRSYLVLWVEEVKGNSFPQVLPPRTSMYVPVYWKRYSGRVLKSCRVPSLSASK